MNSTINRETGEGQAGPGTPPPPPGRVPNYYPGALPVPPPRRRLSGLAIFLIILCGFLILLVIGMAASKTANIAFGGDFSGKLQDKVIIPGEGKEPDKIAIIAVNGAIGGSGSHVTGEGMVPSVTKQLRRACEDSKVKAVLIQMDSPGGGLSASDILRNEIMRLQEAGKKVVVCVGNLAASGGLYISAPADYIVANPTALVGSIGVIMMRFQMEETLRKLGIKYDPIKSTDMKDIGSPFRDLSPDERRYFTDLIKTYNDRFIGIVAEGRKLEIADVRKLANGKIYTADQALEYKLIDEIGYFDDALAKTKELADVEEPRVVKYAKRFEELGFLGSLFDDRTSLRLDDIRSILESILQADATPKVMAIWNGRME